MANRVLAFLALVVVVVGVGVGVFLYLRGRAAGPLPSEVLAFPADTSVLVGVDIRRLTGSAFYKKVLAESGQPEPFKEIEEKVGVNPERDVDRLVMGFVKLQPQPEGLMLITGRFDRAKLAGVVEKRPGVTKREHQGTTVYQTDRETAVAFLDDRTVVTGSPERVEGLITTRAQGSQPLGSNASLMDLVRGVRPGTVLWMAGGAGFMSDIQKAMPGGGPGGPGVPPLKSLVFTVDLDPGVSLEVTAEAPDEKTAGNMADMIRGALAMAALQAEQQPELKELASGVSVTTEASRVHVKAQVSQELVDKAIFQSMKKASVSANEAAAIGDIRTVISGETAYQSVTGGSYGELRCLSEPRTCLLDYAAGAPTFLDDELTSLKDKNGYRRRFYLSPSRDSFAYTAVPIEPGKTGVRGFCGDASGLVCVTADGSEPRAASGRCPAGCQPLR